MVVAVALCRGGTCLSPIERSAQPWSPLYAEGLPPRQRHTDEALEAAHRGFGGHLTSRPSSVFPTAAQMGTSIDSPDLISPAVAWMSSTRRQMRGHDVESRTRTASLLPASSVGGGGSGPW